MEIKQVDVRKKIYYLEVLRAISALAVVILHCSVVNWYGYIGSFNWIVFTVFDGVMRFCVPVFFMISGALFLQRERKLSVQKIYKKNIFKLLVFLVFWGMIYQIYNLLPVTQDAMRLCWLAMRNIIRGDVSTHLWYIYATIGIYILSPILKVFTDYANKKQLAYAVMLLFVISIVMPVIRRLPWGGEIIALNYDKLNISGMGSYVCFFLAGHYIDSYDISKKYRGVIYSLGMGGMIYTIVMTLYICMKTVTCDETYMVYIMPNVALWGIAVFTFGRNVFIKEGKLSCIVKCISNLSLGMYGVHLLIIFILHKMGISTLSFSALLSVPVVSFGVIIISMLLVSFMKKIPVVGRYVC